jgi:hypothetical protein
VFVCAAEFAGVDASQAVEVPASAGDCIVFNPMCCHSGSPNTRLESRYAYFQSYHALSARCGSPWSPLAFDKAATPTVKIQH